MSYASDSADLYALGREHGAREAMRAHLDRILLARAEHIEMFAAAFVAQVGSSDAAAHELVETVSADGLRRTWHFALRTAIERPTPEARTDG